jgi:pilus assembly protein Flp/PilA
MEGHPSAMQYLRHTLRRGLDDAKDRGASAVEYGLMIAAIAAVIVGIVFGLGGIIKGQFQKTSDQITTCSADPTKCPITP